MLAYPPRNALCCSLVAVDAPLLLCLASAYTFGKGICFCIAKREPSLLALFLFHSLLDFFFGWLLSGMWPIWKTMLLNSNCCPSCVSTPACSTFANQLHPVGKKGAKRLPPLRTKLVAPLHHQLTTTANTTRKAAPMLWNSRMR